MGRVAPLIMLAAALCFGSAQDRPPAEDTIRGIKEYEKSVGLPETGNFRHASDKPAASFRCYYTGRLELPETYDGLELRQGPDCNSAIDSAKYDVFFYPIEAVASGGTPVTSSLSNESTERVLVVVPHEDVHESLEKLGTAVGEAASTLVGFVTAAEYAKAKYGQASETYRNLARESELFLAKAKIVNRYWEELRAAYGSGRPDVLAEKQREFEALNGACRAIEPRPLAFNSCPAAMNNAGLAFDYTYTRYYPMVYELYRANGSDLRATIAALREIARSKPKNDAQAAAALSEAIETCRLKPAAAR